MPTFALLCDVWSRIWREVSVGREEIHVALLQSEADYSSDRIIIYNSINMLQVYKS